jgi:hypothetical protein
MGKPLGIVPWRCDWEVTWPRCLWERLSLVVRRRRWMRVAPNVPLDAWRDVGEPISPRLRRGGQTKLVSSSRISWGRPILWIQLWGSAPHGSRPLLLRLLLRPSRCAGGGGWRHPVCQWREVPHPFGCGYHRRPHAQRLEWNAHAQRLKWNARCRHRRPHAQRLEWNPQWKGQEGDVPCRQIRRQRVKPGPCEIHLFLNKFGLSIRC